MKIESIVKILQIIRTSLSWDIDRDFIDYYQKELSDLGVYGINSVGNYEYEFLLEGKILGITVDRKNSEIKKIFLRDITEGDR